eukprot:422452-Pyramimonas_sp.AAC.1
MITIIGGKERAGGGAGWAPRGLPNTLRSTPHSALHSTPHNNQQGRRSVRVASPRQGRLDSLRRPACSQHLAC